MTCKDPVKSSLPTNQHPAVYRPDVLPVTQPTAVLKVVQKRRRVSPAIRGRVPLRRNVSYPKMVSFGAFLVVFYVI